MSEEDTRAYMKKKKDKSKKWRSIRYTQFQKDGYLVVIKYTEEFRLNKKGKMKDYELLSEEVVSVRPKTKDVIEITSGCVALWGGEVSHASNCTCRSENK